MNKIVIFGSTGMTGSCALTTAVEKGLTVRAFVRDAGKIPEAIKDKVEIIVGDVLKQTDVDEAVKGMDGVIIAIGTRNDLSPTTLLSQGTANIITAMKSNNIKVFSACLSSFIFFEANKVPTQYVPITAEHQKMKELIEESGLEYIAVCPPRITDEPSQEMKVEFSTSPGRTVSKYDLGKLLVDSLDNKDYYGKVVGVANVKN